MAESFPADTMSDSVLSEAYSTRRYSAGCKRWRALQRCETEQPNDTAQLFAVMEINPDFT